MRSYNICFVSTNDCFFHLNEKNLSYLSQYGVDFTDQCLKIDYGENFTKCTYSSVHGVPSKVLQDDSIGVSSRFASALGIREGDEVMITKSVAPPLTNVYVRPKYNDHYDLIMKHQGYLQDNILSQVRIVVQGQVLPIHLFSNVYVSLKVEKLMPNESFGQIQQYTEVIVEAESGMSTSQQIDSENKSIVEGDVRSALTKENVMMGLIMKWCSWLYEESIKQKLKKIAPNSQATPKDADAFHVLMGREKSNHFQGGHTEISHLNPEEKYLKSVYEKNISAFNLHRTGALFTIKNEIPEKVTNKYIYVRNFAFKSPVNGQCCYKVLCRLSGIVNLPSDMKILNDFKRICSPTYAYVVSFSDDNTPGNYIYCPDFIMKKMKLTVGSYVVIEEVMPSQNLVCAAQKLHKNAEMLKKLGSDTGDAMLVNTSVYESVISTVCDNIRTKQIINTLIIGGMGTGKTFLLNELSKYFRDMFLYVAKVDCKKLRKSKIPNLSNFIEQKLNECLKFEHSILMLDDMDSLIVEGEEGNVYPSIYSHRIASFMLSLLSGRGRRVSVVATGNSLSNFRDFSTDRGPILFDSIHEIGELQSKERTHVLKSLITRKDPNYADEDYVNIVTDKTKGYTIQDLTDLVEMATVNCLLRDGPDVRFESGDLELALAEKVPLSLSEINLKKNWTIKWGDIGGMEETKKLLIEMFAWPLRYAEIYNSCPLRQQCGVLLYGAPGTGKTLIAGAVANECGLNFISIKGPEVFSKYVGGSEEGIRKLFAGARQAKPCILFFDEFDSLAPRRGSTNGEVNDRVVNQMLTELDGVEELTGVFVLAATSRPDLLDPALLRPGRIDKAVHCSLPNKEERLSILKVLSKNVKLSEDVNLRSIAEETEGYTGADLQGVLYAAQTALVKEMEGDRGAETPFALRQSHIEAGLSRTKPSISKEDSMKYALIYDSFIASRTGRGTVKSSGLPLQQQRITYA